MQNSTAAVALKDVANPTDTQLGTILDQISIEYWSTDNAKTMFASAISSGGSTTAPFILAPNDSTARGIMSACASATVPITGYTITGQDGEKEAVQSIINNKQSMTVFKDVRVLANTAAAISVALLDGQGPAATSTVNNGTIDVPFVKSSFTTIIKTNIRSELISTGYYLESNFTGTF